MKEYNTKQETTHSRQVDDECRTSKENYYIFFVAPGLQGGNPERQYS